MIQRDEAIRRLRASLQANPVTVLLGPRQCGKSTLARMLAEAEPCEFFDLEDPIDLRRLSAPVQALGPLTGLVVLDEIQTRPELFGVLRVLADRTDNAARFLLLGSASPRLVKGASESLAGRVGFVDLSGFTLREIGVEQIARRWVRGGFPRSYLAGDDRASLAWREGFFRTFLERDIPQLGITVPAETLRRFWTMVAHYHAQTFNAAEFARSLATSQGTARRYLDILSGAFMVRVLAPWFENVGKRQRKSPKIYLRDSGLLHALLQLETLDDVRGHPKLGASWEGFAIEEVIAALATRDAYYWATHGGAELDLFVRSRGKRYGFEFKYADAPGTARSMHIAIEDLSLDHLWIVYPGDKEYALTEKITALPLAAVPALATP